MNILSKLYYRYKKILKTIRLYLIIAGPGIIVMVADNDAGGITTYTVTGAQYGFHLIWFLILLGPVAYYVQEMTVRLGAVTKRGHAEAIFHAFGAFWGWFSLLDLVLVDWLTMITEFIGMTAALSIFGVPPVVTVIVGLDRHGTMVLQGRYWTWEKIALVFCGFNLIYIPAAFMINPPVDKILHGSFIPHFPPGGFTNDLFFPADGQHRHHHRSVDDFLSAERGGGQGHAGKRHAVGQDRHRRGFIADGGCSRRLRGPDRPRSFPARTSTMPPRRPSASWGSTITWEHSWRLACSTPGSWARSAFRWRVHGPSAKSSVGRTP